VTRTERAVSVDARLVDRIPADGHVALVQSTYEKVINLLPPDGHLCCLSTAALDDAPRTIRITESAWPTLAWQPGDPVFLCPDAIVHRGPGGDTVIDLDGATRWEPARVDLGAAAHPALARGIAALDRHLTDRPAEGFEAVVADALRHRAAALADALRSGQVVTIAATARTLIGLGSGLTPAGDDILTGLALVAGSRDSRLGAVGPALRLALVGDVPLEARTTSVSAAVLEEAVAGRGRQRLHDLLALIASSGQEAALDDAIARVLEIGHTSGADLLTGIRLGLHAELDLRAGHELISTPNRLRPRHEGCA